MTKNLMYSFVSDKRPNPLGGSCYDCGHCYIHGRKGMKVRFKHIRDKYSGDFRLYPKILERLRNIRSDKPVFFCDCIDYMHKDNPEENIIDILWHIKNNRYDTIFLSVTQNPIRYVELIKYIPDNLILGTTITSNIDYYGISNAPLNSMKINAMIKLGYTLEYLRMENKTFWSIEPIQKFDLIPFLEIIIKNDPKFGVAIGYDNHHNKLDEPSLNETMTLRNNIIINNIKVYDKTYRKAHWEK